MMRASPNLDDEDYLDAFFDLAVSARAAGTSADVSSHATERPHLAADLEGLLALARDVAIGGVPVGRAAPPAFAGYVLTDELGRGGSGVVYRARQESVGRTVAFKMLSPALVASRGARERFAAEARALGRVAHANVVRIHDVIVGEDACGLAMEYVEGTTLAAAIARSGGRSEIAVAVRTCAAVARALAAVHAAGLVHRDVKPANILLRTDGTPVLADFGLVRDAAAGAQTATGEFLGTAAYASPEQIRGDRAAADARTDVYGLGVTLYAALAGRTPFRAATAAETLRRIESGAGEPLRRARRGTPSELCAVVEKAIDPDPARRYRSATEMAEDLERFGRFEPVLARRASLLRRTVRLLQRNRRPAFAALAAGVAALLLAWGWFAAWREAQTVPERFRERLHEARLALIDPNAQLRLFVALNCPGMGGWPNGPDLREAIERSLVSYDAALALRADETALIERETAALVAALMRRDPVLPAPSPLMAAACPATLEVAASWLRAGRPRPVVVPASATPADLRSLGLLAYLGSDVAGAVKAWGPLESDVAFDDPFVAAALGSAWLAVDRPALAASRLTRAVREFPEAKQLRLDLADALIRVGDLSRASAELRAAKANDTFEDTFLPFRLEADLAQARGERARAGALYDDAPRSPTTSLHHAMHLASEGRTVAAFAIAADAYVPFPRTERFRRFMVELVGPSFDALERRERIDALCEAASGPNACAPVYAVGAALDRRGRLGSAPVRTSEAPFGRLLATPLAFRCASHPRLRAAPAGARFAFQIAAALDAWFAAHVEPREIVARFLRRTVGEPWSAPALPEKPLSEAAGARPGLPVCLSLPGDLDADGGVDLLVGDPSAAGGSGEARVVGGRSGATLLVIPAGAAAAFGRASAALGDVDGDGSPEAAIGASGQVRVCGLRDGATRFVVASSEDPGFGSALAACGDLDRDGATDFAVGAPGVGVVACFSGRTGAKLREFVRTPGFGQSLAGGGDADGDGVPDLLIGTPDVSTGGKRWDRTYVEAVSGANSERLWTDGTALPVQRFGAVAAFVGDLDGDGLDDWAVGAPENANRFAPGPGWIAVYSGPRGLSHRSVGGDLVSSVAFGSAVGRWPASPGDEPRVFATTFARRRPKDALVFEVLRARDLALTARFVVPGVTLRSRAVAAVADLDGTGKPVAFAAVVEADAVRIVRAR